MAHHAAMTPFAPTDADLARIDRARAEAWLAARGWVEGIDGLWLREMPDGLHAGLSLSPRDGGAPLWRSVLVIVSDAHDLRGLALWAVLMQWQAPETVEVG